MEQELDYTEFLEWGEFFDYELKTYDKKDMYMAQMAQCALLPYSGKSGSKINDFLIKFEEKKKKSPEEMAKQLAGYLGFNFDEIQERRKLKNGG